MLKRVLLVSFDFPPRRTSGVYRLTGIAKYLLRFGWQATVLAADAKEGDQDPTLLEKIPSRLRIVRARYWSIAGWEKPAAAGLRRLGALRSVSNEVRQPLLNRCLRWLGNLVRSCLYFPDSTVGWIPFGLAKAIQLHREQRYDLVYTTSPHRSAPVIGLLLKVLCGVSWVAEFRDPWYPPDRALRRTFERWLQLLLVRQADVVVVTTNGLKQEFIRTCHVSGGKLEVVRNGFDEDDFSSDEATKNDFFAPGCLHLSHFGTVYPGFSGNFFPALAELVRERPDVKERLRVNIIGCPDETVLRYATSDGLQGILQIHRFMQHPDAIQAMRSSQCLLLFCSEPNVSRLAVSGKIYEYLRVGRPILAVAYEGELKELVGKAKAGWIVEPTNTQAIKRVLRTILTGSDKEIPPQPARPEFVAQFRYDRLVAKLARVLDGVVGNDS